MKNSKRERDRNGMERRCEKETGEREETGEWRRETRIIDFTGFCIVILPPILFHFFPVKLFKEN